jgi:hypothetical protein
VRCFLEKEVLARLKVGKGDTLYITETPQGVALTPYDPAFEEHNQRAAFLSAGLFLPLNGHRLTASEADATLAVFSLAAGDWSEADFAS